MSNRSLKNYIASDEYLREKANAVSDSYKKSTDELERQRQTATQEAKITRAKLEKYTPMVLKGQGLSGNVGLTESAYTDIGNNYLNTKNKIEQNYADQKNAARSEYNSRMLEIYSEAGQKRKTEQDESYNVMFNTMENWNGSSDGLKNYIESNKDKISAEQYDNIYRQYESNISEIDDSYKASQKMYIGESRKVDELSDYKEGENFIVNLEKNKYKVEVGGEYDGEDKDVICQMATNANVGDGEVFYYNNSVYLKNGNKLYNVQDRKAGSGERQRLVDYLRIDEYENQ